MQTFLDQLLCIVLVVFLNWFHAMTRAGRLIRATDHGELVHGRIGFVSGYFKNGRIFQRRDRLMPANWRGCLFWLWLMGGFFHRVLS